MFISFISTFLQNTIWFIIKEKIENLSLFNHKFKITLDFF